MGEDFFGLGMLRRIQKKYIDFLFDELIFLSVQPCAEEIAISQSVKPWCEVVGGLWGLLFLNLSPFKHVMINEASEGKKFGATGAPMIHILKKDIIHTVPVAFVESGPGHMRIDHLANGVKALDAFIESLVRF